MLFFKICFPSSRASAALLILPTTSSRYFTVPALPCRRHWISRVTYSPASASTSQLKQRLARPAACCKHPPTSSYSGHARAQNFVLLSAIPAMPCPGEQLFFQIRAESTPCVCRAITRSNQSLLLLRTHAVSARSFFCPADLRAPASSRIKPLLIPARICGAQLPTVFLSSSAGACAQPRYFPWRREETPLPTRLTSLQPASQAPAKSVRAVATRLVASPPTSQPF